MLVICRFIFILYISRRREVFLVDNMYHCSLYFFILIIISSSIIMENLQVMMMLLQFIKTL